MESCNSNHKDSSEAILAFDTLYTTNHMKILKLLLPYLEPDYQKKLAIFIKWQELSFTLNFFKEYSVSLYSADFSKKKALDLKELLPMLIPYCNEKEKKLISQFSQIQNIMQMMEGFQEYMPIIQQFMSSMSGTTHSDSMFGNGETNMMDLLKNMLSEEQQAMFSMFMNENN